MAKRSETLEGEVGFVVGLTNAEPEIIGKIPDSPLLLPGLGAQGGDLSLLSGSGRSAPLVINVSRGVMFGEGSSSDRALDYRDQIAESLGK